VAVVAASPNALLDAGVPPTPLLREGLDLLHRIPLTLLFVSLWYLVSDPIRLFYSLSISFIHHER